MCGRYTATVSSQATIADRFGPFDARGVPPEGLGRANVCPTEQVLAVVRAEDGRRAPRLVRWGLVPWRQARGRRALVNARDDKLRTSNAWRPLAADARHRALVVADGWLEWHTAEDPRHPRQPFLHRLADGAPFAFAGLWCSSRGDGGEPLASCAIVTVPANREAAILHDRMPAVLAGPEEEAAWLDPAVDLEGALELVRPLPDGALQLVPVSPRLNRAGVEGLDLLRPAVPGARIEPAQTSLF